MKHPVCIYLHRHTKPHLRRSENIKKSNENQETQSQENAKDPLNFEHTEGGLKIYGSAKFTHI